MSKPQYEIEMGVIDEGGCLVPFLAVVGIAGLSLLLSYLLVY